MADSLALARYQALRWNAPLSQSHADALLDQLELTTATSIVDIGCGWGELTLQAASQMPKGSTATGVDSDPAALSRATKLAEERNIEVDFKQQKANEWDQVTDRAICIGSSHTLGGSKSLPSKLAEMVPSGLVLIGDTCWEKKPSEGARNAFDDVLMLSEIVEACRDSGWMVLHLSTSDQREWDDFESAHRAGLRKWLLANKTDPRAKQVKDEQNARESQYLKTYRGELGFVYLVLGR